MSKELERARQELSKKYRNTIQALEAENKKLKEENERLQNERDKAIIKYSKLAIYNKLSEKDQARILSDDGMSRFMTEMFNQIGFSSLHAVDLPKFDGALSGVRAMYEKRG